MAGEQVWSETRLPQLAGARMGLLSKAGEQMWLLDLAGAVTPEANTSEIPRL